MGPRLVDASFVCASAAYMPEEMAPFRHPFIPSLCIGSGTVNSVYCAY